MKLCIQDPSYQESMYLHESLLTACEYGVSGGGAYAFASKEGIELFLEDENFKKFMEAGTYFLVVGIDDITNIRSLQSLKAISEKYNGHLTVKAYVHENRGSTFHPKYSWFKNQKGGTLIIGSGNLTQQGLRYNREAYSVIDCDENDFSRVVEEWNSWIEHSRPFLFDVDDLLVLRLAKRNSVKIRAVTKAKKEAEESEDNSSDSDLKALFNSQPKDNLRKKTRKSTEEHQPENGNTAGMAAGSDIDDFDEDAAYWEFDYDSDVLVAEIPKSGNRWKQVNFDKDTFENFFGATCGENGAYRVLLKSINSDGIMGETEIRPSVSVSSHNYRFELDAASGLDYPSGGERPLGVFAKVSQRDFIYELIMPGDAGYESLITVLNESEAASPRMRRLRYYCKELYERTPDLAIWRRIGSDDNE